MTVEYMGAGEYRASRDGVSLTFGMYEGHWLLRSRAPACSCSGTVCECLPEWHEDARREVQARHEARTAQDSLGL